MTSWTYQVLPSGSLNESQRAVARAGPARPGHPVAVARVVEHAAGVVEHLADVDASVGQFGAGRLDVVHDQLQTRRPTQAPPR